MKEPQKLREVIIGAKILRSPKSFELEHPELTIEYFEDSGFEILHQNTPIAYVEDFWAQVHLGFIFDLEILKKVSYLSHNERIMRVKLHLAADEAYFPVFEKFIGTSGIYGIEVVSAKGKAIYVGQSSNIGKRLKRHFDDLVFGMHINRGLQELWCETAIENYSFYLLDILPTKWSGGMADQTWLADHESLWIAKFQKEPDVLCLNRTDGEFVDTAVTIAHKEHNAKQAKEKKKIEDAEYDEKIRNEKKILKEKILRCESIIAKEQERLAPYQIDVTECRKWLEGNTGFFDFFATKAKKTAIQQAKLRLQALEKLLNSESTLLYRTRSELTLLKEEFKSKKTRKQLAHYSRKRLSRFL